MYRIDASWPAIGIPACVKSVEELPFHAVGEKYITAVVEGAEGLPLLLPVLGAAYELPSLLARLDGLLFTGSLSNIQPHHYGGPPDRPDSPQDPQRDATTLPLIRAAIAAGVPLFCICRGHQELNVALGGTLHTQFTPCRTSSIIAAPKTCLTTRDMRLSIRSGWNPLGC